MGFKNTVFVIKNIVRVLHTGDILESQALLKGQSHVCQTSRTSWDGCLTPLNRKCAEDAGAGGGLSLCPLWLLVSESLGAWPWVAVTWLGDAFPGPWVTMSFS